MLFPLIIRQESIEEYRKKFHDGRIVLAGGCFDILHFGHVQFLKQARLLGDTLMILLESDDHIRLKKKREPVHSQQERAEIVASLRFVDIIVLLDGILQDINYEEIVHTIRPSVIAITDKDEHIVQKKKQAEQIGAELCVTGNIITKFSSRDIITRL